MRPKPMEKPLDPYETGHRQLLAATWAKAELMGRPEAKALKAKYEELYGKVEVK